MDHASNGLDLRLASGQPGLPEVPGRPADRTEAVRFVVRGDELLDEREPEKALDFYQAASAFADRDVAAAGFYGSGTALYRMDRETEAREAWQRATEFGETPVAYRAWRQVAAALVREGDLTGAVDAYRQCEKRAPREDRAEIASRLGWLNKETGNTRAAGHYFARSRGDALPAFMTYLIIAVTAVTSWASISSVPDPTSHSLANQLLVNLELNKLAIAHGEWYRLFTVTLVHDPSNFTNFLLHLGFNMYNFWFAGQIVERMYGSFAMLAMYAICGIGASVGSFVFGDSLLAVGASGAVFGMFGVVVVGLRVHHAILDAQARVIGAQIGALILINLAIGFSGALGAVDNFAHIGGLLTGMWLAFVIPPGQVQTLGSLWQGRRNVRPRMQMLALRAGGIAVLAAVLLTGIAVGTARWQADPWDQYFYGDVAAPSHHAVVVAEAVRSVDVVVR